MKAYEKSRMPQIVFGSGVTSQAGTRLRAWGVKKVLVVTDAWISRHSLTQRILNDLTEKGLVWDMVNDVMPEPTDTYCIGLAEKIKVGQYDCVIGIGGGSPMDAAKTAALVAGIPEDIQDLHAYGRTGTRMQDSWERACLLVTVPTTSGTGAEATAGSVVTSEKHHLKFSFGNRNITADLCLIDPEYTLGMPARPTVIGALDALCHSVESLVGMGANEYTNAILYRCVELIWKWLPVALEDPQNLEAREALSWAAHNSLANGGSCNGHAVGHAIGSLYHLVHGHACIVVLPTVVRHFADYSQEAIAQIAEIMELPVSGDARVDADRVADRILAFYKQLGLAPFRKAMEEQGMKDDLHTFTEKMIPVILDDFKSRLWMPPIHTDDYEEKIAQVCAMIYNEE